MMRPRPATSGHGFTLQTTTLRVFSCCQGTTWDNKLQALMSCSTLPLEFVVLYVCVLLSL